MVAHPSLAGINSGSGLSGSTDWHNGPRARLYMATPKDADDKAIGADLHTVTVMKSQFSAAAGTVYQLRRENGAFTYLGKEGGGGTLYDRAAADAKAERTFLTLLQRFEEQGRHVSPRPSASFAPAVFEREADADGVTKKAFARAMSKLLNETKIHIGETEGPPSKRYQKLTPGPKPKATEAPSDG
jgi:hypothetical protein